jgi:hypothetical protein
LESILPSFRPKGLNRLRQSMAYLGLNLPRHWNLLFMRCLLLLEWIPRFPRLRCITAVVTGLWRLPRRAHPSQASNHRRAPQRLAHQRKTTHDEPWIHCSTSSIKLQTA